MNFGEYNSAYNRQVGCPQTKAESYISQQWDSMNTPALFCHWLEAAHRKRGLVQTQGGSSKGAAAGLPVN